MIEVNVMADVAYAVRLLSEVERKHVPFATSRAINATGLDAQAAIRKGMADRFTLRRKPWADRTVKIKPFATKGTLTLRLFLDPVQGDRLAKFEDGGTKKPRTRGSLVAPSKPTQRSGVVLPKSQRPRGMRFKLAGSGPRATIFTGRGRTVMVITKKGTGLVFRRTGAKRGDKRRMRAFVMQVATGGRAQRSLLEGTQLLFRIFPRARIRARLNFEGTARRVVADRFDRHFARELDRALASLTAPKGLT